MDETTKPATITATRKDPSVMSFRAIRPKASTIELSHSRWQRTRACNHSVVTPTTVQLPGAATVGSSDLVKPRYAHLVVTPCGIEFTPPPGSSSTVGGGTPKLSCDVSTLALTTASGEG